MEPTYRQHIILEGIANNGPALMTKKENLEEYWALDRAGYLHGLAIMSGPHEWEFNLTGKAKKYLKQAAEETA